MGTLTYKERVAAALSSTEPLTETELADSLSLPMETVWDSLEALVEEGRATVCRSSEERGGEGATYLAADSAPLTYDYGETPEAVIRERLELFDSERELGFAEAAFDGDEETARWLHVVRMIDGYRNNPDDLLTVLDALSVASGDIANLGHDLTNRSETLRIDILAALGIEEG